MIGLTRIAANRRRITTLGAGSLLVALLAGCSTLGERLPAAPTIGIASEGPDTDVRNFQLAQLTARLQTMPPGIERDYFSGILANRSGRLEDAIALLTRVLPTLRETHPQRAATALQALGETYLMAYRYREAAAAYDELERHFATHLEDEIGDDAALVRILKDVPVQSVKWQAPVRVATSRNPIGSLVAEITIDAVREPWLLDTGANQSVISKSYANRLGLIPLPGVAAVSSGVTALRSPVQASIVPRLVLGGATLTNVVVIVLDDENLRIGNGKKPYQINAILGYPVLKALDRITFTHDGHFIAGEPLETARTSVPIYLRGLTPAIECVVDGQPLLFTFDTGASTSNFSARYFERFQHHARTWRRRNFQVGGAGGVVTRRMYVQKTVEMQIGGAKAVLRDVGIFPVNTNAGIDALFGNLGHDLMGNFRSVTLDFVNMTFSVGS